MIPRLLDELEASNKTHLEEGQAIIEAFGGAFYLFDLLAWAVLNRSMSLTSGFVTLMRKGNFVAAVPLIRIQLDNFLRFAAGWLVSEPHQFAAEILKGTPVQKLKTKDGKKMRDHVLVEHFNREHDWISSVYENTSGYVHLSEKHMYVNVTGTKSKEGSITMMISDTADHLPDEIKVEAILAFAKITNLILHRAYSWRYIKNNPPGLEKAT